MTNEGVVDTLLKLSGHAHCSAVRIYDLIREVGRGELTADNALHQLVEDYKNLRDLGHDICEVADHIVKLKEVK